MKRFLAPALPVLAAAAALLVAWNDFILRPLHPSTWTGLLSDLGVLFFLPLCLTVGLEALLPRRRGWAAALGFGTPLLIFLLLKGSPAANAWITARLPLRALYDPSDLLALPAWGAALALWLARSPLPAPSRRTWAWVLALGALVTLADAAMPTYGAACLRLEGGLIRTAPTYTTAYQSADGGRTWQAAAQAGQPQSCKQLVQGEVVLLEAPQGVHYRLTAGSRIERSVDGRTWEIVYNPRSLSEAQTAYLSKTLPSPFAYQPGPLGGVVDPATGNLTAAMGLEGVLVVPPSGAPAWAAVGPFRHASLRADGAAGYWTLLGGEVFFALLAGLAWFAAAALRRVRSRWQVALTVLGWLLVLAVGLLLTPEIANSSYTSAATGLAFLLAALWVLALAVAAAVRLSRKGQRRSLRLLATFPLVALLVFLPYLAWGLELLPAYWMAQLIALILVAASLAAALRWREREQTS